MESLIASRIQDAYKICNNASIPKFVGFLRPEETAVVASQTVHYNLKHLLFGGYENAERVFFGVFPNIRDARMKMCFVFEENDFHFVRLLS